MAQIDLVVGDIEGNTAKIIDYSQRARKDLRADLVIFPELSVCGSVSYTHLRAHET